MNYPEKIAELLERKKMLDAEVVVALEGLKDKSVPLDERWDVFGKFTNAGLLQTESYGDGHVGLLGPNVSAYDDFYVERYQTREYHTMYSDGLVDHVMEDCGISQEKADAWREKVLAEGYGAFKFDW